MNLSGLTDDELYLESIVDKIKSTESTLLCIGILNKFGQQCFNAAKEKDYVVTGDIDDTPGSVSYYKYENFENYLKQLENAK